MKFMVNNRLNQAVTGEIAALFPAEQTRVAELQAEGILVSLFVAADFSGAWLICEGDTQNSVEDAVASLPLSRFAHSEITPLAELG
jgi:muconolactone delta-isomerase